MTVYKHELKRAKISLLIWTAAISFMLGVCILIYPEMKTQMSDISAMFADMGSFSAAFGMDRINFGSFIGFFGVECGNVLGLGGALFAAIVGISALAKEEKEHTAEFLLTQPVSRNRVVLEKLLAVFTQIVILNLVSAVVTVISVAVIGESVDAKVMLLLFLAYFILQIEISAVTFGISAYLKGNGLGIGLGIAVLMYFLNIIANLTENAKFLKYLTPFGYTEGADIISSCSIDLKYLAVGIVFTAAGIAAAFLKYGKKDIG
ncbi:MAG: ABC transporter permease subunit [Firmicutes bacterium]|nr:ABC transporter permease subunit [Bacillota bacterium]